MQRFFTLLLIISVLSSCTNSSKNEKLKAANWLLGNWKSESKEGVLIENWSKANDSTYIVGSFFIKGKDTLHFENGRLFEKENQLIYEAIIKGQNNDKPIVFTPVSENEKDLTFENLQNDYPQKIKYIQNSKTAVTLSISGKQAGKTMAEQFKMTKSN